MARQIFIGARIFDGERFHDGKALIVDGDRVEAIQAEGELPPGTVKDLGGGIIAAGFIDAQVNGGAGRMLNDAPTVESMALIVKGHRPHGTTALLPTLITDLPDAAPAAIAAAAEAIAAALPGVAGLHLEGPHLAPARKGAHLSELMRPVGDADVEAFIAARQAVGSLLITVAAEQIAVEQVRRLAEAGVIVSLGHSDCSDLEAEARFDAGARGVTHLFNAMSQLSHRAPGLAGAALDHPQVWCGIIADGHHVDPRALRIALRAKRGEGKLFFVTDAMALVGAKTDHFVLNGRRIQRVEGGVCSRLELPDGTLAGSDLDMISAIRYGLTYLDLSLSEALRMASLYPARFLGLGDRGRLAPGMRADLVHLSEDLKVRATWISGETSQIP